MYAQRKKINFDNYTIDEGISHNHVNALFQDSKGWIWLGTNLGVDRFDGYGYKHYGLIQDDTIQIESIIVRSFFENPQGELFICTEGKGVGKYNPDLDIFENLVINNKKITSNTSVKDMLEDQHGNLFIATRKGVLHVNKNTGDTKIYKHESGNSNSLTDNFVRQLEIDQNGNIWVGCQYGLNLLNPKNNTIYRFAEKTTLLKDEIWEIYIDSEQNVWIGTYNNGIITVNSETFEFNQIIPNKQNKRSLTVRSIIEDKNHKFWIGTRGGLYSFDTQKNIFTPHTNNILENNSLVHNSVLDIIQDKKGDIWVGTRGGFSQMVQEKQTFENFKSIPFNNNYLNNNEVYCFWQENNNRIWIGTESGGVNILNLHTGKFKYLTQTSSKKGYTLNSNCIKAILPDGFGNILIGTFQGGLNVLNQKTKKVEWLKHNEQNKNSIPGDIVWGIISDKSNNIWVATDRGIVMDHHETKSFSKPKNMVNDKEVAWIKTDSDGDLWFGSKGIKIYRPGFGIIHSSDVLGRGFYQDSENKYWVTTTNQGLVLYDKKKGPLKFYSEESGLPTDVTLCVLEDSNNKLWISTANGLSCFNPENESFKNYYKIDGIQGNQFNYNAGYKTPDGKFLFGGSDGFTLFDPNEIISNSYIAPVYITDFKIFNESVNISEEKKSILKKSIYASDLIEIPFKYNVLTFEFTSLNYANSEKNKYKYKLEGFDNNWNTASGWRSATYTNLNPGTYTFKVQAANSSGVWSTKSKELVLEIIPPFYKTWYFFTIIGILIIVLIRLLVQIYFNRKNLSNALLFEKEKAKKLRELDTLKLQFFTNISHEIKTPLTLIISPLEKMLKTELSLDEIKANLTLMHRNARQLFNLVTQLLDYRKMAAGKLQVELKKGDVVGFIENTISSFFPLMTDKNITYKFNSIQDEIITMFDADKLQKIINNIISNAVKYSYSGGFISVYISIVFEEDDKLNQTNNRYIKITIKDNGPGIKEKNPEKIFARFYRSANNSENHTGTGIGLAFTKELIELLNGKIEVESEAGEGTCLQVLLPYINEKNIRESTSTFNENNAPSISEQSELELSEKNKNILLVIEDNPDVRQFIKSHFENDFLVLEANNGNQGLDLAINHIPNAIISDIMMPGLDGNELCNKLKNDERTSHIPIILLSALSSKENMQRGLLKGADDYITKPFDINILQTKIENLLNVRKALREKYSEEFVLQPTNITITSPDERFLQKAIKIVEENIDDPNLDIEKFVKYIGTSRMQLYRKMSALTNMTVKEFINDIRLKRAAQLITENKLTISEIAFSVGYNDISYFGKSFRKKFGMSATEYGLQHKT